MGSHADSPLYGMLPPVPTSRCPSITCSSPTNWERWRCCGTGEWKITYETFRDMGLGQGGDDPHPTCWWLPSSDPIWCRSSSWPHSTHPHRGDAGSRPCWGPVHRHLDDRDDRALARGIIVRNSILLVDFIEQQRANGVAFEQAVIAAARCGPNPSC